MLNKIKYLAKLLHISKIMSNFAVLNLKTITIMDYKVLAETVEKNGHKVKYKVTLSNGKTEIKRLFYGARGVCEFRRNSRTHGFVIGNEYRDWLSCEPIVKSEEDIYKRFKQRVKKTYDLLDKSGLHRSLKDEVFGYILNLTENECKKLVCLLQYINNDHGPLWSEKINEIEKQYHISVGRTDMLCAMLGNKCFKSINYEPYMRKHENALVAKAIENKEEYHYRWTKGYDNSIDLGMTVNGNFGGTYAEEKRGCGNGHYYLLLDATHAIFYEND